MTVAPGPSLADLEADDECPNCGAERKDDD